MSPLLLAYLNVAVGAVIEVLHHLYSFQFHYCLAYPILFFDGKLLLEKHLIVQQYESKKSLNFVGTLTVLVILVTEDVLDLPD